jgi:hypothetical protein
MAYAGVFPAAEIIQAPFGLASGSATVINHDVDDNHWVLGYEQEFALCDIIVQGWDLCASTSAVTFHDTTASDRYDKVQPFAVIVRDGCESAMGPKFRREREKRLLDLLDIASLKAAERELWAGPVTIAGEAVAADRNKYLKDGNATSVGAAVAPKIALAQLEDALANCDVGELGVIHMTRGTATQLWGELEREGDRLTTVAGTNVVVGTGYTAESSTSAMMFATGPVIVHLGASTMLSDNEADYFTTSDNKFVLQAERPVAVTWDGCCHFSATVTYTA